MVYMNEDPTNLVKEYLVSYLLKKNNNQLSLSLSVGLQPTLTFTPDLQMLENLKNVANACSVMLGLHFKLGLPTRPEVHFWSISKDLMALDAHKLSNKVQVLKNKLLSQTLDREPGRRNGICFLHNVALMFGCCSIYIYVHNTVFFSYAIK